jgi:predicted cupin superfamily sugar epimerase
MNADTLAQALNLAPHPEGGAFCETWRAKGLPGASRDQATGIHFMLRAGEVSRWHRVTSDELWLWQGGDPLLLRRIDADGRLHDAWLGLDVTTGQLPQRLVAAGEWQAAVAPAAGAHGWTLVGCVVVPGFDFADFTLATEAEMAMRFPDLAGALALGL